MPDTPRFFRYAILAAMLPVAVLGIVTTPNEYRAVGIDAVDCDGPISVLIPAVPALAAYAIIGWLFLSGAKRHRSLISGGICVVVSLVLVWNIGLALQEHRLNAAEMACGSSGKL
ncbi:MULTISPECIES: hypothetical protein [Rhizobium/Agrobacterium group]|uniref:Uncharacterized protein n=1 Tax=Agrobacterium tumefaciens TaxID=358 RepID=A0A546Y3G3_AGRTU|nr:MULTISPECIES: hypothetical protein [Rhizobium/Agrobacterium group]MBO0127174.1 hypothetical protein [Agrobacterium sp. OT33]NSX92967.1 hypothetical protein [Agrobacterium tumefaciens]NTE56188.1 hypothetical protein [Agrobacterium tumefaciens]NTE74101.1 hypothetical protein [Agrobacterium tumefaciens]PYG58638.1 hypothetical protein N434_02554 [Rhizobium sp. UGM030330-04]